MGHECKHGSCEAHHHHDESCHHHEEACDCCCHHHHKYSEELLNLADEAWMEVLKEKIKEQIKSTSAQHLDQLAKLVTETNHERWKYKMEERGNGESFEERLRALLMQKK